jgi:hypothetical protein
MPTSLEQNEGILRLLGTWRRYLSSCTLFGFWRSLCARFASKAGSLSLALRVMPGPRGRLRDERRTTALEAKDHNMQTWRALEIAAIRDSQRQAAWPAFRNIKTTMGDCKDTSHPQRTTKTRTLRISTIELQSDHYQQQRQAVKQWIHQSGSSPPPRAVSAVSSP